MFPEDIADIISAHVSPHFSLFLFFNIGPHTHITISSLTAFKHSTAFLRHFSSQGYVEPIVFLFQNDTAKIAYQKTEALTNACNKEYLWIVHLILSEFHFRSTYSIGQALLRAFSKGHLHIVRLLMLTEELGVRWYIAHGLSMACAHGQTDVVRFVLKHGRINPSYDRNRCLENAAAHGRAEIVGLLLQDERINPTIFISSPIVIATKNGHSEVVRLLLQDGRADPVPAFEIAYQARDTKLIRLLLSDKRVTNTARMTRSLTNYLNENKCQPP